jgi:hypothetical protein
LRWRLLPARPGRSNRYCGDVNADAAFATIAFPLRPADIDPKLRARCVSAHDAGHHVATLENANLEHAATASQSIGRAIQGITEGLLKLAGRIA